MSKILQVRNPNDFARFLGQEEKHPLICIINYQEISPIRHSLNNYSVYGLFLMEDTSINLNYGCGRYDYKKGSLICVAPGQVGGKEDNGERIPLSGWALLFHPDLLHGTSLEKTIKGFSFFEYRVNEALHMSDEEHNTIVSLFCQIQNELNRSGDSVQNSIIVNYLGLVLNYCQRFYNRQFITSKPANNDLLMKFDTLLREYFDKNRQLSDGLPTVQYCAEELCMSVKYFGDTVKKTTGDTASNYIRQFVIQLAKNQLAAGVGIAQVAYELGFDYPQHFSRLFKKQTGISPTGFCIKRRNLQMNFD